MCAASAERKGESAERIYTRCWLSEWAREREKLDQQRAMFSPHFGQFPDAVYGRERRDEGIFAEASGRRYVSHVWFGTSEINWLFVPTKNCCRRWILFSTPGVRECGRKWHSAGGVDISFFRSSESVNQILKGWFYEKDACNFWRPKAIISDKNIALITGIQISDKETLGKYFASVKNNSRDFFKFL